MTNIQLQEYVSEKVGEISSTIVADTSATNDTKEHQLIALYGMISSLMLLVEVVAHKNFYTANEDLPYLVPAVGCDTCNYSNDQGEPNMARGNCTFCQDFQNWTPVEEDDYEK